MNEILELLKVGILVKGLTKLANFIHKAQEIVKEMNQWLILSSKTPSMLSFRLP